jgi:uncharacterized coiled-coil DUF342 family protein
MDSDPDSSDLLRRIDELSRDLALSRADIDELRARADSAEQRADRMEAEAQLEREMLAELHAEGVVAQEHAEQMEQALRSSRIIGAAMGMIMESRHLDQHEAFDVLVKASEGSNRRLYDIASLLVNSADRYRPTLRA